MKHIIFILSIILSISSCAQDNDFKYQGKMPSYNFNYIVLENDDIITKEITTDSIENRNRIYLEIDSNDNILLNSHIVPLNEFESSFNFVFSNPKQLNHLPKSIYDAVIYIDGCFPIRESKKYQNATDTISSRTFNVIFDLYVKNHPEEKGKSIHEVNQITLGNFSKKLNFYFIEVEEMFNSLPSLNEGLNIKIDSNATHQNNLEIRKRNVFHVLVNSKNQIFVRDKEAQISQLKNLAKEFISNPDNKLEYSVSPKNAIISLQNAKGTNYETYLLVYNALKEAYSELWNEEAQIQFNKKFDDLNGKQQRIIKTKIPLVISEADPIDY